MDTVHFRVVLYVAVHLPVVHFIVLHLPMVRHVVIKRSKRKVFKGEKHASLYILRQAKELYNMLVVLQLLQSLRDLV